MLSFPLKLQKKLSQRDKENTLRVLRQNKGVDFASNDYLGFSSSEDLYKKSKVLLASYQHHQGFCNGSAGSRLLRGNHQIHQDFEAYLAEFHSSESALLFNSGYTANLGFFATIPQKQDVVLYDSLIHASIREGIQLGSARAYKYDHLSYKHLEEKLAFVTTRSLDGQLIYVVTEGVFSMDGDQPNLFKILDLCVKYNAYLVVDEAHSIGVIGEKGEGLVQYLGLQDEVFARIVTFGKAIGGHGAAVLGSNDLTSFLLNFTKSFIYTTAPSLPTVAYLYTAYQSLLSTKSITKLQELIGFFILSVEEHRLTSFFINSSTAIQICLIGDINQVKSISESLSITGFDVRAILSPTVAQGQERLRICLHAFNTKQQVSSLLNILSSFLS